MDTDQGTADSKEPNQLSGPKKLKIRITGIVVLVIVLVAIIAGWLVYRHVQNSPSHKVVFTVNGTKYTENNINNLIAYPLSVSNTSNSRIILTQQAYNFYKEIAVAQKLGLGLSSSAVSQLIPQLTSPNASAAQKNSPWTGLLAYNYGIQQELINPTTAQYSGYAFVFYFAQHIQTGLIPGNLSNMGNAQAIAADQSYAQTKANYYYNELKTKAMTPAQILTAVNADPKLCGDYQLDACQSLHFVDSNPANSNDSYTNQLAESPSIVTYVGKQTSPGLSPIETGQVAIVTSPAELTSDYTYINAYYYFVDLQTAHVFPGNIDQIFTSDLKTVPSTYYGWPK